MPAPPAVVGPRQSQHGNGPRRDLANVEPFRELEPRRARKLRERADDGGKLGALEADRPVRAHLVQERERTVDLDACDGVALDEKARVVNQVGTVQGHCLVASLERGRELQRVSSMADGVLNLPRSSIIPARLLRGTVVRVATDAQPTSLAHETKHGIEGRWLDDEAADRVGAVPRE